MKGRYQETQQNLAIFAIKERYVECDNLYDFFFFFAIYPSPTEPTLPLLLKGLLKWLSCFSTSDFTFDCR